MKPVAYISNGGVIFKQSPPDSMIKLTPLYAMHELTDREIMELYCMTSNNDPLEFARAILKKASEK